MYKKKVLTKQELHRILYIRGIEDLNKWQIEQMFENFSDTGMIEFEDLKGLYVDNIYDFLK